MKKKPAKSFSVRKRITSFRYASSGIYTTIRTQHNMWIHIFAAVIVITAAFIFNISLTEWLMVIFAIGFVISAEVFNSAIEMLVDMVSPEENEKAGLVKDMAAGAVLIAAITAAIIGLIIFVPRIFELI